MHSTPSTLSRLASLVLASTALTAAAADWPQWRGPNRDDHSPDKNLLKSWPAAGPRMVWTSKNVGLGYSGYSIVGDRLYTMGVRDQKECLIALNARDGSEAWFTPFGEPFTEHHGDGPRSTPTIDGGRVYALGAQGNLVCADAKDGKILWKKTMQELGGKRPGWGYCESVLVEGNRVICTPGGSKGTLAALDKNTGAVLWQTTELTDGAQYSSPLVVTLDGKKQYVQLVMQTLFGVDADTGKVLWKTDWQGRTAVISTTIHRDGFFYISSGYGSGCKLVKVAGANAETVYKNSVMKNHHGGVVLVGDHLYGYSDGPGWVCQNFKTGEEVWANKSLGKGAIHYADGLLYCVDEGTGTVAVIEASPAGHKERGRFKLAPQSQQRGPGGRVWTHPVVVGGRLYLRDQELLYCFDVTSN